MLIVFNSCKALLEAAIPVYVTHTQVNSIWSLQKEAYTNSLTKAFW